MAKAEALERERERQSRLQDELARSRQQRAKTIDPRTKKYYAKDREALDKLHGDTGRSKAMDGGKDR